MPERPVRERQPGEQAKAPTFDPEAELKAMGDDPSAPISDDMFENIEAEIRREAGLDEIPRNHDLERRENWRGAMEALQLPEGAAEELAGPPPDDRGVQTRTAEEWSELQERIDARGPVVETEEGRLEFAEEPAPVSSREAELAAANQELAERLARMEGAMEQISRNPPQTQPEKSFKEKVDQYLEEFGLEPDDNWRAVGQMNLKTVEMVGHMVRNEMAKARQEMQQEVSRTASQLAEFKHGGLPVEVKQKVQKAFPFVDSITDPDTLATTMRTLAAGMGLSTEAKKPSDGQGPPSTRPAVRMRPDQYVGGRSASLPRRSSAQAFETAYHKSLSEAKSLEDLDTARNLLDGMFSGEIRFPGE